MVVELKMQTLQDMNYLYANAQSKIDLKLYARDFSFNFHRKMLSTMIEQE